MHRASKILIPHSTLKQIWDRLCARRKSANNFNAAMCKAAKTSIVEVEQVVEVGQMDPSDVDVPHIYVHRVVHCPTGEKRIEVCPSLVSQSDSQLHCLFHLKRFVDASTHKLCYLNLSRLTYS